MKARAYFRFVSIFLFVFALLAGGIRSQAQSIPFTVSFWYPTNGQSYAAPAVVGLHAQVIDSNVVRTVQYFSGTNSIGSVTNTANILLTNSTQSNPFFLAWSNVPAGRYALTAVATDSAGVMATSAPVSISVTNPPPPKPVVYIYSPTNNSRFLAPANLTLYARAIETGGTVATVTFVANSNILGVVSNASQTVYTNISTEPLFALPWSNVLAGTYAVTAIATDLGGVSTTSAVVNITVTNPPPPIPLSISIYSPTNGQNFTAPASVSFHVLVADSNFVKTVQYFSGTTNIGTVSNTSTVLLTNITQSNPFGFTWSNAPAGIYTLTAVATDSLGHAATSAPVSISVTNPPPPKPVVYIYSPTNNSKYLAPASLTLYAHAFETGGTVATVTFVANSNILGVVSNASQAVYTNISTAPLFALPWTNVVAGAYAVTAIATDLGGVSTTSAVVNITVTNPPPPIPLSISIYSPTNGQNFTAPASVSFRVLVADSNFVKTVQYYSGTTNIGTVSNTSTVLLTNITQSNPFGFTWSNVPAGAYTLTAVATDSLGHAATSAPVSISVTNPPPPKPVVYIYSPTNNSKYLAPASLTLYAHAFETGGTVATVTFVANSNILGVVSNASQAVYTNISTAPLFALPWTNVVAGTYAVTAIATDLGGVSTTSTVVSITVTNPPPPPKPVVYIYSPANNSKFVAPVNLTVSARAIETGGAIASVTFVANSNIIGVVTASGNPTNATTGSIFSLAWPNVLAGNYLLTAIATDLGGNSTTSAVVSFSVTNPPPPLPLAVRFYYPTNGQIYVAPANVGLHAFVVDSHVVRTVQYFAGSNSLGIVTNTQNIVLTNSTQANPFFLDWSNVPAGAYTLTAVATDATGATATSPPVNIYVLSNLPPVVTIYAPDPVAVAGTNCPPTFTPTNAYSNYCTGSNTATFLVRRNSATNVDLTVKYAVGGTASNGVDYVAIPSQVTIPAGKTYALVTITPINNNSTNRYETVTLALTPPSGSGGLPPAYNVGSPSKAGAVIVEKCYMPIATPHISSFADGSIHVSLPASNGLNIILESSKDLLNWQPVCTNTVLKGSAQYVAPNAASSAGTFYRIVVAGAVPSY
jgi:hypothetical protein